MSVLSPSQHVCLNAIEKLSEATRLFVNMSRYSDPANMSFHFKRLEELMLLASADVQKLSSLAAEAEADRLERFPR